MTVDPGRRSLRICIIGDSIVAGTGDEAVLGWPGRLARSAVGEGEDLTVYALGVRGDTSREVAARWHPEARARLPDVFPAALVFAFGLNDCAIRTWQDGRRERRVAPAETESMALTVLREARALGRVGLVGPAPVDDTREGPQLVRGVRQRVRNEDVEDIDRRLAAVARAAGVSYVGVFDALREDARWQQALRAGDGVHPTAIGYDALAELVGEWPFWTALRSIAKGGQA